MNKIKKLFSKKDKKEDTKQKLLYSSNKEYRNSERKFLKHG